MVRINFILLFTLCMWMTSCSVEEFDKSDTDTETFEPEVIYVNDIIVKARPSATSPGVMVECITVSFPFQMVDTKGNLFDVDSSLKFEQLVSDSSARIVDFVYPLTIIDNIGLEVNVIDLWEFASYAAGCFPIDPLQTTGMFPAYVIHDQNSCFNIKYPIQVQNAQGVSSLIEDERTFIQKHAAQSLYFVFPFSLIDHQGQEIVVNDGFDLSQLLIGCNGSGWGDTTFVQNDQFAFYACYEYVFPINVVVFGQTAPISIQDATTLGNVFMQGRFIDFGYPITLKTLDGEFVVANSQTELNDLANECPQSGDFFILLYKTELFSPIPCYDLIFPISVSKSNGPTITLQSYPEINSFMLQDSSFNEYSTNYPVSISLRANIEIRVLHSLDDLINVYITCPE